MNRTRTWPLLLIAAPAAVAVWSGWVGLGALCGFGPVRILPGISHVTINTAITLPVGVESYGAFALWAWLASGAPAAARSFARRSAIGALALGCVGQVAYHLLAAAHAARAPALVVVIVACLPVVTLSFAAALVHLMRAELSRTEPAAGAASEARTGAPANHAAPRTERPPAARTEPPASRTEGPVRDLKPVRLDDPTQVVDRDALVAELAAEISRKDRTGGHWFPDYEALMIRTGYRRSWCEKAVRDARRAANPPPMREVRADDALGRTEAEAAAE